MRNGLSKTSANTDWKHLGMGAHGPSSVTSGLVVERKAKSSNTDYCRSLFAMEDDDVVLMCVVYILPRLRAFRIKPKS